MLDGIGASVARLNVQADDREALTTVRRAFHTLKGSGRMVGARDLGEFAWSIENLLNRVLDNTLTRSPAILETLRAVQGRYEAGLAQGEALRSPASVPRCATRASGSAARDR